MPKITNARRDEIVGEIAKIVPAAEKAEIRRSISRVALRLPPGPTLADVRRTGKALARFRGVPVVREAAEWFDLASRGRQEPPPKADARKWWCAAESFCLLERFGAHPTGSRDGAFYLIAALLHEACTGKPASDTDMHRACRAVLTARRKAGLGTVRDR